ncbi:hypothetical protein MTR67_012185 [Solanum verrucosum]|uniref:Uncharacterized protein n=1 Tax=Solanum verrucosum TaxID=315347 RepID=A0AAF0QAV5_SOLVR|nr:hypothetical protein MTR67_012185 [Solanum verrucosum]
MAKMITQMDLLAKDVMEGGYMAVNAFRSNSGVNPDVVQIQAMYNKEVQFLSNKEGGFSFELSKAWWESRL